MKRLWILSGLLLGAALIVPMAVSAGDGDHDRRYYDRDARDYHTWNDHEDRAYRVYLGEQHQEYREFRRVNATRRREYFLWRHEHPDTTLFKVEIK
jgi:hypothetical protein